MSDTAAIGRAPLGVIWAAAVLVPLLGSTATAAALDPKTTDPVAIVKAVSDQSNGDRSVSRVKMTSREGGRARERLMQVRGKELPDGRKTLILIEKPAQERDTGLLSVVYDSAAKDDEQWLYLPEIKRATRIAGSGRAGAFMGSDFSYADLSLLSAIDPSEYALVLQEQEARVDGEACWLIEATPKTAELAEEIGYVRLQWWISKTKLIALQSKGVAKDGKLKYIKASDVKNVGGVWTPHSVRARTVRNRKLLSETVLQTLSVKYDDPSVTDADFTRARLAQGA